MELTEIFMAITYQAVFHFLKAQYGHVVVHMLMGHLDKHSKSPAELKASITDVLSETVIIAAGGSIGG